MFGLTLVEKGPCPPGLCIREHGASDDHATFWIPTFNSVA